MSDIPEQELPGPYEMEIPVTADDIDRLGHVSNIVYLRWVQDVAVAHWYAMAHPEDIEKLLWVILRHEIDYKRPAYENDTVIARTWVGSATRRAFERHTELLRATDRKLLARALTLWCPVDPQTKRAIDVGDEVYRRYSQPPADDD